MTEAEFREVSEVVAREVGLHMPQEKRHLLESRLSRRLRELGLSTWAEYLRHLHADTGGEILEFIDVSTTHHTHFFREAHQLHWLAQAGAAELGVGLHPSRPLSIWCGACSTGEEPYSLAMLLEEHRNLEPNLDYHILATDISKRVVDHARLGVFPLETAQAIPESLRSRYLLRSKDRSKNRVRIIPGVRQKIEFRTLNLTSSFNLPSLVDVAIVRNVLIYFDMPTQQRVLSRICSQLHKGGLLVVGVTESLLGLPLPLRYRQPAIWTKL